MTTFFKGFRIEAHKLDNDFVSTALRDASGNLIKTETIKELLPEAIFNVKEYIDLLLSSQESNVIA